MSYYSPLGHPERDLGYFCHRWEGIVNSFPNQDLQKKKQVRHSHCFKIIPWEFGQQQYTRRRGGGRVVFITACIEDLWNLGGKFIVRISKGRKRRRGRVVNLNFFGLGRPSPYSSFLSIEWTSIMRGWALEQPFHLCLEPPQQFNL